MKNTINRAFAFLSVLVMVFALTACSCSHEWSDADCTTPKTCVKCKQTEGEALGHQWTDADCIAPKTCSVCGETEGEALGHSWVDADCVTAKTCSVCGETEGEALGHNWVDATYSSPKKCSVCKEKEGSPLYYYWNEPVVEEGTEITIGFYDDGAGTYSVEIRADKYPSGLLMDILEGKLPTDCGINGKLMLKQMNNVLNFADSVTRQGTVVTASWNTGMGFSWTAKYNSASDTNGLLRLSVTSKDQIVCFAKDRTILSR